MRIFNSLMKVRNMLHRNDATYFLKNRNPVTFPPMRFISNSTRLSKASSSDGITYQADGTIHNLHEIVNVFRSDPEAVQLKFVSEGMLRAITLYSDKPWQTARDRNGKLLGIIMITRIGDSYTTADRGFIIPEARGMGVSSRLFKSMRKRDYPLNSLLSGGKLMDDAGKTSLDAALGPSERYHHRFITVCYGVPDKYDKNSFPDVDNTFDIVPYSRGRIHDKLVLFDTYEVHEIPRQIFLQHYFHPDSCKGYVAVDKQTGDVVGCGGIQDVLAPNTQLIAPLYAKSDHIALALFRQLMEHHKPGNDITLIYITGNKVIENITDMLGCGKHKTDVEFFHTDYCQPEKYDKLVYLHCGSGQCLN